MTTELIVFAKEPVAGKAKTRLIPALGDQGAARFQAALTHHTLKTATQAFPGHVTLYCTPSCEATWFQVIALRYDVSLRNQCGQNLGARMNLAINETLEHAQRALLIGTDCPLLSPEILLRASDALKKDPAVFMIPADDGGYVLVGLNRPFPNLFNGISWGSEKVMNESRSRIDNDDRAFMIGETLWDIDRPEDLRRLDTLQPQLYQALIGENPT